MKWLYMVTLLLSLGCAGIGKVASNLTEPATAAEAGQVIDKAVAGVPGPGGVDLGSIGIGGGIVSLLGIIGALLRQKKETDQIWDATHRPVAGPPA